MKNNKISRHIGIFLRRSRKEKNMTGKELAQLMHISQQQISRYETGITSITLEQLEFFLLVLDKNWFDVFQFIDKKYNPNLEIDNFYVESNLQKQHKNKPK